VVDAEGRMLGMLSSTDVLRLLARADGHRVSRRAPLPGAPAVGDARPLEEPMTDLKLETLPGVAELRWLHGKDADPKAPPALLVEVPHGADRRAQYDALRARLKGPLPADLEQFFFANTDVGAWQCGEHVAERVVALRPDRSALLVRCLIPRTFIDTNRLEDAGDALATGGLTAGLAPYITNDEDKALLVKLHRGYVRLVAKAFELVCGSGGFGFIPHTYGPRSMGIAKIDEHIVKALHEAAAPGTWETWPLRPEVDLLTKDGEGKEHAPPGLAKRLIAAYAALSIDAAEARTYVLHPSSQGWAWVMAYPEQVLTLELRRDLLVEDFQLFAEQEVSGPALARLSAPLVQELHAWLEARGR
jgi:hypothetical protein